jgi:uncharacterized membrane protein
VIRRQGWLAGAVAALYLVTYATLAVLRHRSYHSFGFDLGLFDQIFWNTTQGRLFESTISQAQPIPHSLLGDHFSPAFLLIVPFYWAYPHPETLLVIQTLVLALGAWPVYRLAKLKLPASYPLLWVLIYFLFIPLAYINLYDFHEVALAVAPLGFALYFLESGRRAWFVVFLLVTLFIKEEMGLIATAFGLYALLGKRDWKLGLGVLAGGFAAFELAVQVLIPYFAGGAAYPYIGERYADVGGSPAGILRGLVTNPLRIVHALLQTKKVFFLIAIFGPVLGLSAFAGWASLLILPTLGYLLLSNYEPQFSFTSQYSAPLIPLVIGTAIIAMARLPKAAHRPVAMAVLVSSLIFSWAFGDLPYSRKFNPALFQTEGRYTDFVPILGQIPPGSRVSAENGLVSHLTERRHIYDWGYEGVQDAQWIALDYAGSNYSMGIFEADVARVESLGYQKVASGYGLALFRKP